MIISVTTRFYGFSALVMCDVCGAEKEIRGRNISQRFFCSKECEQRDKNHEKNTPWWKAWMINEDAVWSHNVKERYGNKCAVCFSSGELHTHRIAPALGYPELEFDPQNGIALCKKCHHSVYINLRKFPHDYEKLIKQVEIEDLENSQNGLLNRHALITTAQHVGKIFEARVSDERIPLVCTSGAFDPLCVGELKSILTASMLKGENGLFVVVVNGDSFLQKKKGFSFMPLNERMEIIASIKGVDYVVPWDDETLTVIGAIDLIRPNIFAKGGNKSKANVPEYDRCLEIGCGVVFGMGGHETIRSKSTLVAKAKGE
jgi:glycerol-3-phosphate cytidylyltransferase-like family protein